MYKYHLDGHNCNLKTSSHITAQTISDGIKCPVLSWKRGGLQIVELTCILSFKEIDSAIVISSIHLRCICLIGCLLLTAGLQVI